MDKNCSMRKAYITSASSRKQGITETQKKENDKLNKLGPPRFNNKDNNA